MIRMVKQGLIKGSDEGTDEGTDERIHTLRHECTVSKDGSNPDGHKD